jgi:hypothetical protein
MTASLEAAGFAAGKIIQENICSVSFAGGFQSSSGAPRVILGFPFFFSCLLLFFPLVHTGLSIRWKYFL